MFGAIQRFKWWLLLAVLLVLNAIRYWPVKHALGASGFAGGPPPPGLSGTDGFPEPDAATQASIAALPAGQRKAVEDRMRQERLFFVSIQNLPETERREKIEEHFAQNPPGTGEGAGGFGGFGAFGGPGSGGTPHIPPPDVRRGMDQGLVNAMKNAGLQ